MTSAPDEIVAAERSPNFVDREVGNANAAADTAANDMDNKGDADTRL